MIIEKDTAYGLIDYSEKELEVKTIIELIYNIATYFGEYSPDEYDECTYIYRNNIVEVGFRRVRTTQIMSNDAYIGTSNKNYFYLTIKHIDVYSIGPTFWAFYDIDSERLSVENNIVNAQIIENLRELFEYERARNPGQYTQAEDFEPIPLEETPTTFIERQPQ